ncbi:RDD family protein [Jatrophihabitans sp. DSM 45814]
MVSGEAVTLELQRAGLGSRLAASLLDAAIQLTALVMLALLDAFVGDGDDATVAAVLIVELVAVFGGYPTVFEWLTHGRTPGKMALGLRVVRDDGGPIGFRQAFVRGMSSLLIEKPGLIFPIGTAAGAAVLAISESNKRIGDFMAGTFVLSERAGAPNTLIDPRFGVPYELQGWASSLDLSRVDDGLAFGVRQFVQRASQMSPEARDNIGETFRIQVLSVITPPPPWPLPTPVLLMTVLAERRRRAGLADGIGGAAHWPTPATTPAAPVPHLSSSQPTNSQPPAGPTYGGGPFTPPS